MPGGHLLTPKERRILDRLVLKTKSPRSWKAEPRLKFRNHHCGKLLEEFDPIITDETFCVVVHNLRQYLVRRFNCDKSLFLLGALNPVRRFAIGVCTSSYFDVFVMLAILINCIFLAVQSAPHESEYAFLTIFTVEMVMRIVARGFAFHRYSYMRNPWNFIDFCIILGSYFVIFYEIFSHVHKTDITGLRTFRVLRILKTITLCPGLMTLVRSVLRACRMLLDVLVVTIFFLVLFALIGLQIYVGDLRNKCVRSDISWSDDRSYLNKNSWLVDVNIQPVICGNVTGARHCPLGYTCLPDIGDNPNRGYTSFDHFGLAMLTTFQIVTRDFWEDVYNKVNAACGASTLIFFIPVVFFGSFYLMNLTLAVVTSSYEAEAKISENERQGGIKSIAEYRNMGEFLMDVKRLKIRYWVPSNKKLRCNLGRRNALIPVPISLALKEQLEKKIKIEERIKARRIELADPSDVFIEICDEDEMSFVELDTLADRTLDFWKTIRNFCKKISDYVFLEILIIVCIGINTIIMACEFHEMPESFAIASDNINTAFTIIFATEMTIKIVGSGKDFFRNRWNVTDFFIVVISVVCEFAVNDLQAFTVLRMLRLVRVIRLVKKWHTMRLLVSILITTAGDVANISVVLFIVIFIFAVTGMHTFSTDYSRNYEQEDMPRWNFTSFWLSVMMVFRVLCGEWIESTFECFEATHDDILACVSYFLPTLLFGNFLVFNLFLALLLNAFSVERLSKNKPKKNGTFLTRIRDAMKSGLRHIFYNSRWKRKNMTRKPCDDENSRPRDDASDDDSDENLNIDVVNIEENKTKNQIVLILNSHEGTTNNQTLKNCCPKLCYKCCEKTDSLNPSFIVIFRQKTLDLVNNRYFEATILSFIFASSISLCFDDNNLSHSPLLQFILKIFNYFFTLAFVLEMVLKWIAHGFAKYFADGWCWLDFVVVVTSIADLIIIEKHIGLNGIRAFRTLRALRPLRAVSIWEGMRMVVNTLLQSIPSIGNVLVVCLFCWLIFSIMGINFFAGKFFKCVDENGKKLEVTLVGNRFDCRMKNLTWKNSNVNFDNVLLGYLALFQVATFEGWMEIMEDAVDSRGINLQPERDSSTVYYLFFVVFIIIGSFITLNLFIGVIIDTFNEMKKENEGRAIEAILTEGQKKYYRAMLQLSRRKPRKRHKPPTEKIRLMCYNFCVTRWSEFIVLGIIICNMMVMVFEHYGQANGVTVFFQVVNTLFIFVYTAELVVKILAFGYHFFFDLWNVFDFMVWLISVVGLIVESIFNFTFFDFNTILIRVFRLMRLGRALRLMKGAKGIRHLIFTLMISLPALFNIGLLLFLVNFVYAIIGMSLFGQIKDNGALDDQVNFRNFGTSMRLLFRLSTGGGWNDVLDALMIRSPDCEPVEGECGSPVAAPIYMMTFVGLTNLIIINMYVAIILENYSVVNEDEELGISVDDMDMFYEYWAKYDPKATQFISVNVLSDFLDVLDEPLRIPKPNKITLAVLGIPVSDGNMVHCLDLQEGLIRNILGEIQMNKDLKQLRTEMEKVFLTTFPSRKRLKIIYTTRDWYIEDHAASVITKFLRTYCRWKEQQRKTEDETLQCGGECAKDDISN